MAGKGMKVVCIGLGNMGAPLASRIAARHSTAVWDLTDGLSTKFASQREGCVPIVTTEQLGAEVADCDAVLTCVPNTAATHKIWEMLKPSLGANSGGTFWIDATSGRADEAAVLAQALWDEHKIRYLDCAVSGGPRGAEGGILAALVGGDEETFARAQGVIGCFSDKITHLGPPGSGHLVKAMNNAMLGAQMLVASEAMAAISRHGVDVDQALKAINGSSGRSWVTMQRFPDNITTGKPYGFALGMHCKDMENAMLAVHGPAPSDQGNALPVTAPISSPMLELARSLMNMGRMELGGDVDHTQTCHFAERAHGVSFESPDKK